MARLRGEDREMTLEEFDALAEDAVPADPLRKPLVPGPVTYDDDELDDRAAVAGLDAGCDGYLTLTATRHAAVGEELFNTFGDHGNALLLHKYGFAEWENDAGGVTVSPEIVGELLGFDVFAEALAALDGDGEEDSDEDEGETDEATNASDEGEKKSVVAAANTSADGIPAGAAAARAAGWSGGLYEISRDGEPSRDLLMLFAVALADPDDPNACDPSTGVPPNIAAPDRELLRLPGVAEATLPAIKARGETLPEGTVEGDLEKAREAARRDGNDVAAGGARAARRRRCYSGRKSEPCANAHSSGSWIHSEPNFEVASGTRSRTGTGTGTRWRRRERKTKIRTEETFPRRRRVGSERARASRGVPRRSKIRRTEASSTSRTAREPRERRRDESANRSRRRTEDWTSTIEARNTNRRGVRARVASPTVLL